MKIKELAKIATLMREIYGRRAEEFALRMVSHFEARENPAAEVWRSVHESLRFTAEPSPAQPVFGRRHYRNVAHANGEGR